ncbi:mucin-1 [Streptomyces sp. F63]|uniref:mucin-1 n=1 Tax=Streptomyces sp. F63 TaxID=2824887 RepID=UPI001B394C96|nr:mucin-1 [Streptomyces sp. F63]MBQ0987035.1 mucin-1 [Streptomyces sp. F63]
MRYAPPGLCLNDFALLSEGGVHTLLHLQGPWTEEFDATRMETSYGRATSTDLVRWEPQGGAFGVGLPGGFDDAAVWTMHPFPHEGGLTMYYTGVRTAVPGGWPIQSVGLARSARRDGTGWRRHGTGPVVEADPRWYRTGEGMAWRDPFVVRDDDGTGWTMVLCASDTSLPQERSGCVGLAVSADLVHWEVRPPLISPGDVDELECPVLERVADGWLLFGCVGATRRVETWRAPRLDGPWERVGPLAPADVYAPRVTTAPDGQRVVLHTTPRRTGLSDSGAPCRGMLAQPKVLAVPADGVPRLEWWSGLDAWLGEPGDGPALHAAGDVEVAGRTEVVLREDAAGPALLVGCAGREIWVTGAGGSRLRETVLDREPGRLRILTVGEYVEVYADGVFVLAAAGYAGRPVAWRAVSGGTARAVRVRPVRLPDPDRGDVSAVWPGPVG